MFRRNVRGIRCPWWELCARSLETFNVSSTHLGHAKRSEAQEPVVRYSSGIARYRIRESDGMQDFGHLQFAEPLS